MALFGFGKKKAVKAQEKAPACCCAEEPKAEPTCCCGEEPKAEPACCCGEAAKEEACCCGEATEGVCCVKVLGAGCKSCHEQYENAKKAVAALGLDVEVEYVTDMEKVMAYGVMTMPVIVVNEKVAAAGKVLKAGEVEALLRGFMK